jgi:ABC-2 type transport system permease protein
MFKRIASFEFRYLLRNPLLWVTAAATFAFVFVSMASDVGMVPDAGLLENSTATTLRNYVIVSLVFMFVTTAFVANVVIRDDETGFGPIIRSTRITRFEYLIGRFAGAFAIAALCLLVMPVASWLGSLMPSADPATLGPYRLVDHLYGYFLLALPNLLITSAVFFALATITRSMMATYLGLIGFVCVYAAFEKVSGKFATFAAFADPFGISGIGAATKYWTIAERAGTLPQFAGALLYNRILWIAVALGSLALAYSVYRFADHGISKRELKKQKQAVNQTVEASSVARATSIPSPRHDRTALGALLWMRTRFEMRQVLTSPAFAVLMSWGLFLTTYVLLTQRDPDGRPSFPTTLSMIPEISEAFAMVPLIVAIFYAGELVWRERDRRIHEIVDATSLPNWAYVVPKTAALLLVLLTMLEITVIASIIVQLSLGYTAIELDKYMIWYLLPESIDMMIIAALAIFVHSISPHKAVGWGVMAMFVFWRAATMGKGLDLLHYGAVPYTPLSDLNAGGSFWIGAWTLRVYWAALAVLLLLGAHLLWRRGTEVRLKPRVLLARRRLRGAPGVIAAVALFMFTATGAYAYYNTNILNEYTTKEDAQAKAVDFEQRYGKYMTLLQPTVTELKLDIALYPDERRAITKGRSVLRNTGTQSISEIHVRSQDPQNEIISAAIEGARMIHHDTKHGYRIYRLERPMQAGEDRVLTFQMRRWHRGFQNGGPNTRMIENGTFLTTRELIPGIGMSHQGTIMDPDVRRKYGLPELQPAKLEDVSATTQLSNGEGWGKTDITVSTSADQTPIAPGSKVSDVTRGGRRTARFVSTAPTLLLFSIQSARYAEKHRTHAGVDLSVYYHAAHQWNVDRMLVALATSLDYYQANFGPYQFDHVRIVEFPGFQYFAQALPGTIAYSEDLGFVTDFRAAETVDHVTMVTAHELAHQYWGHQLRGAETEGALLLTETLPQYSAMMVAKQMLGEDKIRRGLQFQLDEYLKGRGYSGEPEPPLVRVLGQNWIHSRKGAVVMYLLQKRMGEDAINRGLRKLLARYKFAGPPYPRSLDLITALRAEATTPEQQNLITDLFERVTLYDLKATAPTAVRRADGKWDVTVPIEAKKIYVQENGEEKEAALAEDIEVGLFTAEPGRDAFDQSNVIMLERRPIRPGKQILKFVTDRKPTHAGVDPYNFYIDRNSADNVVAVR